MWGISMTAAATNESTAVFKTALGWMGVRMVGPAVGQLTFGHASAHAAALAIGLETPPKRSSGHSLEAVVERLEAYANGDLIDFRDVLVDPGPQTVFQARVIARCREIPYGVMMTYGQLAAAAGSPKAARAVGNCMAANSIPLIIPCHRVVPSNGAPGPYSAPGGTRMKQRLLRMESQGFVGIREQLG
jgi:methylated-DNA-[protein]-cysteine S-methyltransferase